MSLVVFGARFLIVVLPNNSWFLLLSQEIVLRSRNMFHFLQHHDIVIIVLISVQVTSFALDIQFILIIGS